VCILVGFIHGNVLIFVSCRIGNGRQSDFEFANSDCSNKHGAYGRHDILKIVMSY